MKTITVHVTQDDIDQGQPESCDDCPIALAISRALGLENTGYVAVGDDHVDFYCDDLESATMPQEAKDFVHFFDSRPPKMFDQPQPFSFELRIYEKGDAPNL